MPQKASAVSYELCVFIQMADAGGMPQLTQVNHIKLLMINTVNIHIQMTSVRCVNEMCFSTAQQTDRSVQVLHSRHGIQ